MNRIRKALNWSIIILLFQKNSKTKFQGTEAVHIMKTILGDSHWLQKWGLFSDGDFKPGDLVKCHFHFGLPCTVCIIKFCPSTQEFSFHRFTKSRIRRLFPCWRNEKFISNHQHPYLSGDAQRKLARNKPGSPWALYEKTKPSIISFIFYMDSEYDLHDSSLQFLVVGGGSSVLPVTWEDMEEGF